jgi:hypothetical protein
MASSSEAFEKFERWRNSKTSLKVTMIVGGKSTEVLIGRIFHVDSDSPPNIGFSNPLVMHSFVGLDIEDSSFSVEEARLVATRNESDWIIFEEIDELLPIWPHPVR